MSQSEINNVQEFNVAVQSLLPSIGRTQMGFLYTQFGSAAILKVVIRHIFSRDGCQITEHSLYVNI